MNECTWLVGHIINIKYSMCYPQWWAMRMPGNPPQFVFKGVLSLCLGKYSLETQELDVMRQRRDTGIVRQLPPLLEKNPDFEKNEWAVEYPSGDLHEVTCWVELLPIWKLEHFLQKHNFCFRIIYVKLLFQEKMVFACVPFVLPLGT